MLALFVIFMLVGCGGKKRTPIKLTLSTEDSEAILNAAGIRLPDTADVGEAGTASWLSRMDPFRNYYEGEMVSTGYYAFTERYGGKLDWQEVLYENMNDELANLVLAGTSPDMTAEECMFVPFPRYEDGDGNYYINSQPTGYMLCSGAPHPEGAALLASCMRFKVLDPTVIDIDRRMLKEVYLRTDEMLEMWDTCERLAAENVRMFYTGNLQQNLRDAYDHLNRDIQRTGGANTWAQIKEKYSEQIDYYLEDLNATLRTYIETGDAGDFAA